MTDPAYPHLQRLANGIFPKTSLDEDHLVEDAYLALRELAEHHNRTDRRLWVIVPVKGRNDLTGRLLQDLARDGLTGGLVICDNGSTVEDRAELDLMVNVLPFPTVILTMPDVGIHTMWNRGIDHVVADGRPADIAIVNNDIRLAADTLNRLQQALVDHPFMGTVAPNYDDRPGIGIENVTSICAGQYDGQGGLPGFAFMFRSEIGYRFPEQLYWWYGDNHFLAVLLAAGWRAGIVLDATCEHVDGGSGTGDWDDPKMKAVLEADAEWWNGWLARGNTSSLHD